MTLESIGQTLADVLDVVIFLRDNSASKDDVHELRTKFSGMEVEFSGMKTDISTIKQDVSELKVDMSSVKDELCHIHHTLDQVDTRVQNLETKVQEDGGLFAREIVSLKERVSCLETQGLAL